MSAEVTTVEAPAPVAPEAPAPAPTPSKTLKQLTKEYKQIRRRIAKEKKTTTLKGAELTAFLAKKESEKKEAHGIVIAKIREILKENAKKETAKPVPMVKKAKHIESRTLHKKEQPKRRNQFF
jgi:nucleotidyltransferase/DNA polymerase involved in DNA repair